MIQKMKNWASQYDWETERKIIEAIEVGLFLGMVLDFLVIVYIRL